MPYAVYELAEILRDVRQRFAYRVRPRTLLQQHTSRKTDRCGRRGRNECRTLKNMQRLSGRNRLRRHQSGVLLRSKHLSEDQIHTGGNKDIKIPLPSMNATPIVSTPQLRSCQNSDRYSLGTRMGYREPRHVSTSSRRTDTSLETTYQNMMIGIQFFAPIHLPTAAENGWRVTKVTKNKLTASFRSSGCAPMSSVKPE